MPTPIPENIKERLGRNIPETMWPWRLFIFSLLVFTTTVVLYAGLEFGYKPFLKSAIAAQDKAINNLASAVSDSDREKFISFYSQLLNLEHLLKNKSNIASLLPFLENNTNKKIAYKSLDFRASEGRVNLIGEAASYEVFSAELEALNRAAGVKKIVVTSSENVGGRINFQMYLLLDESLFK
ncbi:MAG: hypothetical protein FJY91_02525 [Candidatus Harrisonbacteria bacterium]|nr:hypothetical protein [Candidatus Harrisonbacteria bacterium]